MNGLFSSYCGSRKKGTRRTEKEMVLGACGLGWVRISWMAFWRCFLPMYPLGHNVSDMSSTGMTSGDTVFDCEEAVVEKRLLL